MMSKALTNAIRALTEVGTHESAIQKKCRLRILKVGKPVRKGFLTAPLWQLLSQDWKAQARCEVEASVEAGVEQVEDRPQVRSAPGTENTGTVKGIICYHFCTTQGIAAP